MGIEGLNRRRKKRTSIETNIRVALEKSFLEVGEVLTFHIHGIVCVILMLCTGETQVVWFCLEPELLASSRCPNEIMCMKHWKNS